MSFTIIMLMILLIFIVVAGLVHMGICRNPPGKWVGRIGAGIVIAQILWMVLILLWMRSIVNLPETLYMALMLLLGLAGIGLYVVMLIRRMRSRSGVLAFAIGVVLLAILLMSWMVSRM